MPVVCHDRLAVERLGEGALARLPHPLGDHAHGLIERQLGPLLRARCAVLHLRETAVMRDELIRSRAFRTEMAARDRRLRIALDADDLPVAMVNKLTTSDAAVRTDGPCHIRPLGLRPQRMRGLGHRLDTGAVASRLELTNQRPLQKELSEHARKCMQFAGTERHLSCAALWSAAARPPLWEGGGMATLRYVRCLRKRPSITGSASIKRRVRSRFPRPPKAVALLHALHSRRPHYDRIFTDSVISNCATGSSPSFLGTRAVTWTVVSSRSPDSMARRTSA